MYIQFIHIFVVLVIAYLGMLLPVLVPLKLIVYSTKHLLWKIDNGFMENSHGYRSLFLPQQLSNFNLKLIDV